MQNRDDKLREKGQQLSNQIINFRGGFKRRHPTAVKNFNIAGSMNEGALIPRLFQYDSKFPGNIHREIEVDVECLLFEIPISMKAYVEDIARKAGYLRLRVDFSLLKLARNIGWNIDDEHINKILTKTCSNGYLQCNKFKNGTFKSIDDKTLNLFPL